MTAVAGWAHGTVVIAGAGLGGLALAHGLAAAGIPVAVYERETTANARYQGHRISLNPAGLAALRSLLPDRLINLVTATAAQPYEGSAVYDASLRPLNRQSVPDAGGSLSCCRHTLREILLHGLADQVAFGSPVTGFRELNDGVAVDVAGDLGAVAAGLLVGADGVTSAVRGQVLPGMRPAELRWAIYGRTAIDRDIGRSVPGGVLAGFSRVLSPEGIGMSIGPFRKRQAFNEAAADIVPGLTITELPDCLMWTLGGTIAQAPLGLEELRDADAGTLHRIAREQTASWHPVLQGIVGRADVSTLLAITVRAAPAIDGWSAPRVTMLGDAVHVMPPGRALGANTTFRDAALLTTTLQAVARGADDLVTAKADYERRMLCYSAEAVATSVAMTAGRT